MGFNKYSYYLESSLRINEVSLYSVAFTGVLILRMSFCRKTQTISSATVTQ